MKAARAQVEVIEHSLQNLRKPLSKIAQILQDVLTQKLVAYMIGISDGRDIGRYSRAERSPHPPTAKKLRDLFTLLQLLSESEDSETIQVWFTGKNPELGDKSPARALHESFDKNFENVRLAAVKFIEMGT